MDTCLNAQGKAIASLLDIPDDLCAGCVRSKNVVNILYTNTMDGLIAGVSFYLVGYGLAFGVADDGSSNSFIGTGDFSLSSTHDSGAWHFFFFHWAVVAAVATIVAGAIAERCRIEAYSIYTIWLSIIVYPIAAHWLWSVAGWMSWEKEDPLLGVGVVDFAGTSVVHMVGGVSAFMAALFIGPRAGRYLSPGKPNPAWNAGHSAMLICTGTMVLWAGWYGFNSGSALFVSGREALVGRTAVITTLGACGGGVAAIIRSGILTKCYSYGDLCNGILCGLVSVTAAGCVIDPWAAVLSGFLGAFVFFHAEPAIARLGVDDAVGASAMHGCVGAWGTLVTGLFAREEYVRELMGPVATDYPSSYVKGILLGGDGRLLGCQVIVLAVGAWTAGTMAALFFTLKSVGVLRVSEEVEEAGLDVPMHGGPCYPEEHERRARGSSLADYGASEGHRSSKVSPVALEVGS